jgi:hypothetical protein
MHREGRGGGVIPPPLHPHLRTQIQWGYPPPHSFTTPRAALWARLLSFRALIFSLKAWFASHLATSPWFAADAPETLGKAMREMKR